MLDSERRARVFLTSTMDMPFIRDDIDMLRNHVPVDVFIGSGWSAVVAILWRMREADVGICWFGSVYAFVLVTAARLWRKRSVIILGGVDVAREPSLGYGIWLSPWKSILLRYALRRADLLLVVDDSLRKDLRMRMGEELPNVECLPTGYDADYWTPEFPKEDLVLCVANCNSWERAQLKGIDLLADVAWEFPDMRFRVIGVSASARSGFPSIPPNLDLLPLIPRSELLPHYRRARIYCQISLREGLPNALCEALLCGCIGIGTNVGGVPTALDGHGLLIEPGNRKQLCEAIEAARSLPEVEGLEGRRHVAARFPRHGREARLVEIVNHLANAASDN